MQEKMIRKILVATDFSEAANNAARYGAQLATVLEAKLVLFHAFRPLPVPVTDPVPIVTPDDLKKEVKRKLHLTATQLDAGDDQRPELACEQGNTVGELLKAARDHHAELIVVGMKQEGKAIGKVLGNTVTALIRKSRVPVLIVPELTTYTPVSVIALANDEDLKQDTNIHLLDVFRTITYRYHAKLYLVRVSDSLFKATFDLQHPPARLTRVLKNHHPVFESKVGATVPEALNDFVARHGVKMLAMMPHDHSLLERWLISCPTRTMAFKTGVPLLILPGLDL